MATLVGIAGTSAAVTFDPAALQRKEQKLFSILADMGQVIVAYSGGTDSAYLMWAAAKVLGENAVAITADSAPTDTVHCV